MAINFKLTAQDLTNYRYAVRDRLANVQSAGLLGKEWVRAAIVFAATLVIFLGLDAVVPQFTGARLSMLELITGFVLGLGACLAMFWLNYFDQRGKLVRPDGPALSEHTVSVNTTGLNITAPQMTAHYAWAAIQDVTVERDLVILWLEPSVGLVIPARKFADVTARNAFIADIETRRTEAGLPRAGSFSAS